MEQATQSGKVEILMFYSMSCESCKKYLPVFKIAKNLYKDLADFTEINIDTDSSKNSQYTLTAVPTTIAVKDGNILAKRVGEISAKEIRNMSKL